MQYRRAIHWMVGIFFIVMALSVFRAVVSPNSKRKPGKRKIERSRKIESDLKGKQGEDSVNILIEELFDQGYQYIPNVTLPTVDDATTQIDHIIVSRYGMFLIETKNYAGWIFGREGDPKWTQTLYGSKKQFQNPLRQSYKHVKTLAGLIGIPINGLFPHFICSYSL